MAGAVGEFHRGFGGHSCTWGADKMDKMTEPTVLLQFAVQRPADQPGLAEQAIRALAG